MASASERLAEVIYPIIRPHAAERRGRISYSDLCTRLPPEWDYVEPHSDLLAAALGVIVDRCRAARLPPLSAIVVYAGAGRQPPGPGYWKAAHPRITDEVEQMRAWEKDFEQVHAEHGRYPDKLP